MFNITKCKTLMEAREINQKELALRSGLSERTVSQALRGETKPTISTLRKIALALEVKVRDIVESVDIQVQIDNELNRLSRAADRLEEAMLDDVGKEAVRLETLSENFVRVYAKHMKGAVDERDVEFTFASRSSPSVPE